MTTLTAPRTCREEGCPKPHRARGMCAGHYARAARLETPRATFLRKCETCGQGWTTTNAQARWCSPLCHRNAQRADPLLPHRHYGPRCAVPPEHPARWFGDSTPVPPEHPARWFGDSCPVLVITCGWCGAPWAGPANADRTYCRARCKLAAARKRSKASRKARGLPRHRGPLPESGVNGTTRLRIFTRDGWRCWMCDRLCSRDSHQLTSATVDHLVPRSLGGGHDDANLATACMGCNSRRGARPLAVDVPSWVVWQPLT